MHASLNSLLQSSGAIVMKWATVRAYERLCVELKAGQDLYQLTCKEGLEGAIEAVLVQRIKDEGTCWVSDAPSMRILGLGRVGLRLTSYPLCDIPCFRY